MSSIVAMVGGLFCIGVFVLAFGGGGAYLVYRALQDRKKAAESVSWPSTGGQITEARVERTEHTDSDGDSSYSYVPTVRYSYQVGEQVLTGKRIGFGFGKGYGRPAKAEAALARFAVGSAVTVYYNPADPADAVLERTATGLTAGLIVGVALLLVAACLGCPMLVALVGGFFGR